MSPRSHFSKDNDDIRRLERAYFNSDEDYLEFKKRDNKSEEWEIQSKEFTVRKTWYIQEN